MKKMILILTIIFLTACNNINEEKVATGKVLSTSTIVLEEKEVPTPSYQDVPIDISFVGDVMMDWSVKDAINAHGPDFPFQQVKADIQSSDFSVANLETAITTSNSKEDKQYTFKSNPQSIDGLKNAGFDLVSLANNHTMDFGTQGLLDTFKNLKEKQLPYIGAGNNVTEAFSTHAINIEGRKIKFLAVSRVLPHGSWFAGDGKAGIAGAYEESDVINAIKREKEGTDFLFVYIHWGVEKNNKPEAYQVNYAHMMIDAGADAIIGSHPHVLQGFEYYNNKPIAYSLGNFLFPDYVSGKSAETGILTLNILNDNIGMSFKPYAIGDNQVVSVSGGTRNSMFQYLQNISKNVEIIDGKIIPR